MGNQKTTRPRRIMNKITLVIFAMMVWTNNADHCFSPCKIVRLGPSGTKERMMGNIGDQAYDYNWDGINGLPITNYHCVMKCANQLSQATMGTILQPSFEKEYNHECVLIENLDYCVQYWKVLNDVDCEEPIRTMVKNTFGVSKNDCLNTFVRDEKSGIFEKKSLLFRKMMLLV